MSFFKQNKGKQLKTVSKEKMTTIYPTIEDNFQYISTALFHTDDLKTRKVTWKEIPGVIIYLETMVDTEEFQRSFLLPLSEAADEQNIEKIITSPKFSKTDNLNKVVSSLLKGDCALFHTRRDGVFFI